ncbi:hypothetical protein [Nosocomiicoccus ampullae]|uniref:hypothetical protein n=1 Tax=Nosocomiicoccus ampullae TaxID=489910 RepID=UPI001C5D83FA|nr:hypothetical protein [Nosocomiicoccus ampullae]QYA47861.1 hypothetical protein KPF52_05235 [Nosocomiicoccus ampullae]
MIIQINTEKVLLLKDKHKNPSIQIIEYGRTNNLNGYYVFDTILVKGLKSTRFLKVKFENGEVDNKSKEYVFFDTKLLNKINHQIFIEIKDLKNFLFPSEIKKISS